MPTEIQRAFEERAFGKPTIVPRFFEHARKDSRRTAGYGMNMYTDSTYVEIKTKGRKDTTAREATEEDKALFSHHYEIYQQRMEANSIPMEALAGYSIANRYILRDIDITTVEELDAYNGNLPLASLKLMKHCAAHMLDAMSLYKPPNFSDDKMEVPRETIQAQRQVLPSGEGLGLTDGNEGVDGGGIQQLGVNLDEEGNIIQIHGQEVKTSQEGVQKESHQKVISFY